MSFFKKMSPGWLLVGGFAAVIFIGAMLLMLPVSRHPGVAVSPVDALFTSTSAVCVTGLIAVDTADTFTVFGRIVVAVLIQIGGLGVSSVGVGFVLLAHRRLGLKGRLLVKEALNLNSFRGVVVLVRSVLLITLCFELLGAGLSYISFSQHYPPLRALEISLFHSVAAFNNSGFDILGGLTNLIPFQSDVLINLTTCGLIFFGGIGFLTILDLLKKRRFKTLTLHSKVVLLTSLVLILIGTVMLKFTDKVTWLGALFHSVSARTAGFSTYPLGQFSNAGLFTLTLLMFIGASPGSTGGGIKTSTLFTLLQTVRGVASGKAPVAFKRSIPRDVILKAFIVTLLSALVVCVGAFVLSVLEPEYSFMQNLFEITSAFGTVGLSTGITPFLSNASKILIVLIMFIGRLGPLTIASLWAYKTEPHARYSEENITIG
ncbi:MAG: potassium transporter TrkG [Candidatus Limiplasma sp.]|nr:potassium transporter TrkG [Candidatus Limiplasma sp.]